MARVGADEEFDLLAAIGLWLVVAGWLEIDAEPSAWHAEPLNFGFHGGGESLRRRLALDRQLLGFFIVMPLVGRELFLQPADRLVIGVQVFQLLQQSLLQAGQLEWLYPMFTGQGVDRVQALLECLEALGIGIEVVNEAIQLAHRFLDLDLGAAQ